jgi:hypothetical protein
MGSWHSNNLTAAANAAPAAGDPVGYAFDAQATQHVVYVGAENDTDIHELWWDITGWHHNNLTQAANAPVRAISVPTGYVFAAQATQHVVYLGSDGHIHELWWDITGWHHNDLTRAANAPVSQLGSRPAGYVFDAQGTQHVVYVGSENDRHIHELWWDITGWHHNDLTQAANATVGAFPDPAVYVFDAQGTQHVVYQTEFTHIEELWWDSTGWHHNDLTTASGARPNVATAPSGYAFNAQGTQHVVYEGGDDDRIHELWWDASGWHQNDLTKAAGGPLANGRACGYVFDAQGTQHVVHGVSDGTIEELWWDTNGWHANNLSGGPGSTADINGSPSAYVFNAQNTQHIVYRTADNNIEELWWG